MQTKFFAQHRFLRHAKRWLQFIGRLEQPLTAQHKYAERVAAFAEFQMEKGLSAQTISSRGRLVQAILDRLSEGKIRMETMTPAHIDAAMSKLIVEGNLARASIRTYAAYLRAFFRYAETRGWCRAGLAVGIIAPCIYAQETSPSGPSWEDVQRLLATTERGRPCDIRDQALLLLLIVYGFRSGEVLQLRLDDLDWEEELIHIRRSKQRRTQVFPLSRTVGDAILSYLKEVRPHTSHREVFLAFNAPLRPLRRGALNQAVAWRLRSLGLSLRHYGPHALRHACATRLLDEGHSLKEIGDYLGHSRPESTLVYAKVNDAGLRAVADFDLEGLL
jgi:site-specific recombinase XerD